MSAGMAVGKSESLFGGTFDDRLIFGAKRRSSSRQPFLDSKSLSPPHTPTQNPQFTGLTEDEKFSQTDRASDDKIVSNVQTDAVYSVVQIRPSTRKDGEWR